MADERLGELERLVDAIDEPGAFDSVLALISQVFGGLPLGGSVSAGIANWQALRQSDRTVAALRSIIERLRTVQADLEFIRTPEGQALLERVLQAASDARHADKRAYYANALAHSVGYVRPDAWERALLLNTLDAVGEAHLALLAGVASDPAPPINPAEYFAIGKPAHDVLHKAVPGASSEVLDKTWEDLANLRIVESKTIPRMAGGADPPTVTPFGRRFLAFVTRPPDEGDHNQTSEALIRNP